MQGPNESAPPGDDVTGAQSQFRPQDLSPLCCLLLHGHDQVHRQPQIPQGPQAAQHIDLAAAGGRPGAGVGHHQETPRPPSPFLP